MNFKHILAAIFTLLCWGCQSPTQQTSSPSTLTSSPAPATITPTQTVTVTSTLPPKKTQTAVIWTPIPTIPVDQRENYLLDLLVNYDECSLPCWWGIQPGVTTWEGAREVMGPLGRMQNIEVIDDGKYEAHETVNQDNFPNLGLTFFSLDQETIQYMLVSAGLYYSPGNPFYYEDFEQAWWRYSMDLVLNDFGVPDLVSIYVQPSIGSQIFLIYEQKGIFARYTFEYLSWYPRTDQFEICPNAENMLEVVLFLKSPSDSNSFEEVTGYFGRSYLGDTKLLEDISDLSVEEFHGLFTNGSAESCLVLDGTNWP